MMAGITALHFVIFRGKTDQALVMIDNSSSIEELNAADGTGQTPMHMACYKDFSDVVRRLVERGANVTAKDASGNTPVHAAAACGALLTMEFFIEKGLVPSGVKNKDNLTPMDMCKNYCPPLKRRAMLQLLEPLEEKSMPASHGGTGLGAGAGPGLGARAGAGTGAEVKMESMRQSIAETQAQVAREAAVLLTGVPTVAQEATPQDTSGIVAPARVEEGSAVSRAMVIEDGDRRDLQSLLETTLRVAEVQQRSLEALSRAVESQANSIAALVSTCGGAGAGEGTGAEAGARRVQVFRQGAHSSIDGQAVGEMGGDGGGDGGEGDKE